MTDDPKTTDLLPLPLPRDNWRSRWVQFAGGSRLHRLAAAKWDAPDELIQGDGIAVCERRGRFVMPGFISRADAQRCPACCRTLGIPSGRGAPFNVLEGEAADA